MARTNALLAPLALLALVAPSASAQPALSPRNASYTIEATLDVPARTLTGRQVLTWTNVQAAPTDTLWFHLYWNAWRNDRSTWMIENRRRGRRGTPSDVRREDWAWQTIDSARLLPSAFEGVEHPGADLGDAMFWAAPDDGNLDDRTVAVARLPRAVRPGETIRVEMSWRAKIPRTFARTGHRGDYFFVAHWFPKLGVYEEDGWSCPQYHASTEYHSDYGRYDVTLRLPRSYVVGATGVEVDTVEHDEDGTVSRRFVQDDVHGFAWTAGENYIVRERTFKEPNLGEVRMRLLLQPEHRREADRHFEAAAAAWKHFGHWYGPYPYDHVTLVDPAWGSGAGGMEYPTLFTCGTRLFAPRGADRPESVTVHEMGHQFWYGVVGNDEFSHAWLDEGLNTFSTFRTLDEALGVKVLERRYLDPPGGGRGFLPVLFREIPLDRWERAIDDLRQNPAADVPATPSWRYDPSTGRTVSYDQTALWLRTLERHLGWDTLREILATFYARHAFDHPTPDDFFAIAEEIAGPEVQAFFDQVHRSSVVFDYAIRGLDSFPAAPEGWVEDGAGRLRYVERGGDGAAAGAEPGAEITAVADASTDAETDPERNAETETGTDTETRADPDARADADASAESDAASTARTGDGAVLWRSRVRVERRGSGTFPVDVRVVFDDGTEVRERWDGRDRHVLFEYLRDSPVRLAEVDPDRVLMLDIHPTNNAMKRRPEPAKPAAKWTARWLIWFQDALSTFAFFV